MTINGSQLIKAFLFASDEITKNQEILNKYDSYVGDGDHGSTANRGFQAVKANVQKLDEGSKPEQVMTCVGKSLVSTMGGAIGPIFGGIFTSAGKYCADKESLTLSEYGEAFAAGLQHVQKMGGAKPGDRTLVDALNPYVESIKESAAKGEDFSEALEKAAQKAEEGAESTKDMVGKKGRAKFLQEKSVGYRDAGASSFTIVVKAISDSIKG